VESSFAVHADPVDAAGQEGELRQVVPLLPERATAGGRNVAIAASMAVTPLTARRAGAA
jgi:hypothetical protein